MLAQQIGAAQDRTVNTVAPPITMWLPAASGDVAAIVGEFLSGQPILACFFIEHLCKSLQARPSYLPAAGFTSSTPGSGVTLNDRNLGSEDGA